MNEVTKPFDQKLSDEKDQRSRDAVKAYMQ